MSDQSSFDFSSAVGMLVVTVALIVVLIPALPALLRMAWQMLPGVLVLWLIVAVLRGMVKHLLG
jgi:hypothetical protein